MKEYLETIHIVYIPTENVHGIVEDMGLYASVVKYSLEDVEYEELMDNEDFIVVDEISLMHVEETD